MDKTYHFMAGLPRSGSTVLSALLNQHPEVYAGPHTDLLQMLYNLKSAIPDYQSYRAGLMHEGYKNTLETIPANFYSHIKKPVVIDKNRGWGTPYNFNNLSPFVNKDVKIILTMRPILEVLASFIKVSNAAEKKTGVAPYLNTDYWVSEYRSKNDAQVDYLMAANQELDRSIFSISNLLANHGDRVFVVWFNDLLDAPQTTMNGIYDFLGVERHNNDFNKIKEINKHDDVNGYGVIGLHDLAAKLKNPKTKPEDYLSDYIVAKYKNALDFLWA